MRSTLLRALAFSSLAFVPACSSGNDSTPPKDGPHVDDGGPAADGGPGDDGGPNGNGDAGPSPLGEPDYLKTVAVSSFVYASDFGSPYDSILAAPMQSLSSAIAPGYMTKQSAGQVVSTYTFQEVDSSQDLYSALDVSASLSVSSGAFSGSAKMSFAQQQHIDSTKLTIFVDGTSVGLTTQIVDPQLTASAAALTPSEFYARYGDRYAAQIVTGVELFGTLEIETHSEEDKRNLAASLSLSYGPSNLSGSYSSTFTSAISGRNVSMHVQAIGFPTPTFNDAPSFLNAVSTFGSAYSVDAGANTASQALQVVYTSYYGIPGYPGVPAGTDKKVSQHAQAVSDYMLYNSLVSMDFAAYFADPNYASLPFLTGMKAYRDALGTYVTSSLTNSQALPPLPTPAATGKLETYTTTATTYTPNGPSSGPQYIIHTLDNGFVPKRLSDYEIPLRYTKGSNSLNGVTFSAVRPVQSSNSTSGASPLVYQFYPVDKTQYPQPQNRVLSYQWDTGTYQLPGVFSGGQPSQSLITSALEGSGFTIYDPGSGKQPYQFVIIDKATGLVMTDNSGANTFTTVNHFDPAHVDPSGSAPTQIWGFDLACSPGDTMPWQPGALVLLRSQSSTNIMDFQNGSNTAGTKLETFGFTCNDEQKFNLVPEDSGGTWAIEGYNGYSNLYVQALGTADGASVVANALTPADNQLWVIIPVQNIDTP